MTFEQQWIEHDYNPFILFSSNGKILSLNSEAQFLLGSVSHAELYELATTYANISFGFKTTFIELKFGRYKFFGLTVGYENEDEIGIKFYQAPSFEINQSKPKGELTNIYTLVDLCISTNSINSDINFIREFDPTIPEVIIDSNSFIKVLNKAYNCFKADKEINTKIFYRVGEHIKLEDKKYSLFSIEISGNTPDEKLFNELEILANNENIYIDINKKITINIPMVTS
jgi:nitrogen-specific signal transduction histidine kinase